MATKDQMDQWVQEAIDIDKVCSCNRKSFTTLQDEDLIEHAEDKNSVIYKAVS